MRLLPIGDGGAKLLAVCRCHSYSCRGFSDINSSVAVPFQHVSANRHYEIRNEK
jgi:hypothetical protein